MVIATARNIFQNNGSGAVEDVLLQNTALLKKWNINFINALTLSREGHRPQVSTVLQAPADIDFIELDEEVRKNWTFQLRLSFEKRIRSTE